MESRGTGGVAASYVRVQPSHGVSLGTRTPEIMGTPLPTPSQEGQSPLGIPRHPQVQTYIDFTRGDHA